MALKLVTPPAATPVTIDEAKAQLNITHTEHDAQIVAMIQAATSHLDGQDGVLGRCIMPQTWDLTYDDFPDGAIMIPLPPLQSVQYVSYIDTDGNAQEVDPNDYVLDLQSYDGWVVPRAGFDWPATFNMINAMSIRFVAGYTAVPAAIKAAVLLMVADLYEQRGTFVIGSPLAETNAYKSYITPFYRTGV